MKRITRKSPVHWLLTCLCLFSFASLVAQDSIPNASFENWTSGGFGGYENPSGGWWASLNPLSSLGGPVTVEKTSDAFAGTGAAKLTTKQWGTLLLPGLLVSGVFDAQNPNFLVQGKPFTARPEFFDGHYKYTSVSSDSAGIAALLTRWNTSTNRRDTIAEAAFVEYNTVGSWTAFNLPFVYSQTGIDPDSIIVAFVSSFGGQNFQGQVGSTLWVDGLRLTYLANSSLSASAEPVSIHSAWAENRLQIQLEAPNGKYELRVCDLQGREVLNRSLSPGNHTFDLNLPIGGYLLDLRDAKGGRFTQKTWKCF